MMLSGPHPDWRALSFLRLLGLVQAEEEEQVLSVAAVDVAAC